MRAGREWVSAGPERARRAKDTRRTCREGASTIPSRGGRGGSATGGNLWAGMRARSGSVECEREQAAREGEAHPSTLRFKCEGG